MGGFGAKVPRMSAVVLFFSIAALGMPGLGNFVGEFLALLGAFQSNMVLTVISAFGLIFASVYSLWVIQKAFHGPYNNANFDDTHLTDLSGREMVYFTAMILGLIWMGMYPQSFLSLSESTLGNLLVNTETLLPTMVQN